MIAVVFPGLVLNEIFSIQGVSVSGYEKVTFLNSITPFISDLAIKSFSFEVSAPSET